MYIMCAALIIVEIKRFFIWLVDGLQRGYMRYYAKRSSTLSPSTRPRATADLIRFKS